MASKKHEWQLDPAIIQTVVARQADSLEKAILEAAMNAADAKSKSVVVNLNTNRCTILDTGVGIRTKKEIVAHFGTFGKPHDESEEKRYGRFRMGRAQLFCFGRNTWWTHDWLMEVDWKKDPMGYELTKKDKKFRGCHIEIDLYEELPDFMVSHKVRQLKTWLRYLPIEVVINGERIDRALDQENWTLETDEAYIKLDSSAHEMHVYNDGIYCRAYGAYLHGTGGVIVSKKGLKVNFARNTVQDDCPVWKKIVKTVKGHVNRDLTKKTKLNKDERLKIAAMLLDGELATDVVYRSKMLTLVTGRYDSVNSLASTTLPVTIAPPGDRIGDSLHRSRSAYVLSEETLKTFNAEDLDELIEILADGAQDGSRLARTLRSLQLESFEVVSAGMTQEFLPLEGSDLTTKEKVWQKVMQRGSVAFTCLDGRSTVSGLPRYNNRRIVIGESASADGWTDGSTYVAIDRKFLKSVKFDLSGFTRVASLVLHEFCHGEQDTDAHDHDQCFYEMFHDNAEKIGGFVTRAMRELPKAAKKLGYELPKHSVTADDVPTSEEAEEVCEAV